MKKHALRREACRVSTRVLMGAGKGKGGFFSRRAAQGAPCTIVVRNQTSQRLPLEFFRHAASVAARALAFRRGEVAVVVVGGVAMADLARRHHRGHRTANVLAFPYVRSGREVIGDIVLCAPHIRREARQYGRTAHQHFGLLIVHGMVHLAGYTHATDKAAERMEAFEERIARRLGLLGNREKTKGASRRT